MAGSRDKCHHYQLRLYRLQLLHNLDVSARRALRRARQSEPDRSVLDRYFADDYSHGGLDDLVRHGKVRYVGCSNLPAWQVMEALWTAKHHNLNAFVSCQDEYSLVVRDPEKELIPAMQHCGLGLLPFFPLASGLLTGKYRRNAPMPGGTRLASTQRLADRFLTDANWAKAERLADFAEQHGHSLLELAFSWLAARPTVASVIAGATKPEQIEANVKAVGWKLTPVEIAEIDKVAA